MRRVSEQSIAEDLRWGGSIVIRSGETSHRFRWRAGRLYVVSTPVPRPVRHDVEEYARRLHGHAPDPTIDCTEVEARVRDALRRGAHTFHLQSDGWAYTFRSRPGRGLYVVEKQATAPVLPEVEALVARLRRLRVCRRRDCRRPFEARGRQTFCSPACARTVRSRRARSS